VNTIFARHHNLRKAERAYHYAKHCILGDGSVTALELNDIDVQAHLGRPHKNPFMDSNDNAASGGT
jgi:hypothetical protein